ncbi:P-loop containing nucleoside triphosphate hydrolase protein [Paxillus ammoniavirescens]|nr:P-loop containing nucleoside triphosphate hydrolase protein [Paxillus ammoniavirescens]
MSRSINIILFGETGVGKSSVINLIAGRQVADVSPDVNGCTMSSTYYTFPVNGREFKIWDTVGLEEPELGVNGYVPAIEKSFELIQQLFSQGGVDLLLFCTRGNRVTATTQSNYRLFYEVLCGSKVPIALVVTHLEREDNMEGWWTRNIKSMEKYGIKSAGHACVTTIPGHEKYGPSRNAIKQLLTGYDGTGRYNMPSEGWFIQFLRLFGLFAPPKDLKGKKLQDVLTKRCGLKEKVAEELVKKMEARTG